MIVAKQRYQPVDIQQQPEIHLNSTIAGAAGAAGVVQSAMATSSGGPRYRRA